MTNEQFFDEVYKNYNELFDSYYPPFSAPYPKRLTREEFINECKANPEFAEEYEVKVIKGYDLITEPTHLFDVNVSKPLRKNKTTIFHKDKKIEILD